MSRTSLLLFAIGYGMVNATSLLLVRSSLGAMPEGSSFLELLPFPPVKLLIGLALYVVSFVAFIASTKYFPITVVFPMLAGSAYALIVLGGWGILGESISRYQAAGLLTVGVGIVLLQVR